MARRDPVREYAERVVSGDIVAGELVRLACQRHIDDLARVAEVAFPYRFDLEAAEFGIQAFELFVHWKGRWAGQPVVLEPWQCFVVGSVFGWLRKQDGLRRFRKVYEEVARKNGKSLKAAGVGLILAFFDGEPAAEVYAAATKKDQAKIVWGDAAKIVQKRPAMKRHIKVWRSSSTLECSANDSVFRPLGADSDTQDGLNIHGGIVDELHKHRNSDMLDVLETGTGARSQPLIWIITTAGQGQESVWWHERKLAVDTLRGLFQNPELFVFIATLDEGDDWRDRSVWVKANPNLGVSVSLEDMERKARVAEYSAIHRAAFQRLHLNMPISGVSTWLDLERWDACGTRAPEAELEGRDAYGGLDLSSKKDLTAFGLVVPDPESPGDYDLVLRLWMPEESIRARADEDRVPYDVWAAEGWITPTPGNVIDYAFVEEEIRQVAEKFSLEELAFDPYAATQTSTRLGDEGLTMVSFRQGFLSMSEPTKEFEKLVLSRRLRHDRNPVLRWMAANCAVAMDAAGNVKPCKKTTKKRDATARIDGIVAAIMAVGRATLPREESPYKRRGVLSV